MPDRRTLSEEEFNTIKQQVLSSLPDGLSEADFTRAVGPRMEQALAQAEYTAPAVQGSAVGRFLGGAGEMLNPITMAQGAYQAVRHPIDTATNLIGAQVGQGRQAIEAARQGRYSEAVGHGGAALLPLVGPMAANIGEQIGQSGDVARGVGQVAGLAAPFAAGSVLRGARAMVPARAASRVAGGLEESAAARVADVMAPKIGANKPRFGNMAQKVAPELAARGEIGAFSREGLHANIQARLATAQEGLDAASDARLVSQQVKTADIAKALDTRIRELTAEPVEGSLPTQKVSTRTSAIVDESGRPMQVEEAKRLPVGRTVEPSPNMAQLSALRKMKQEVLALGPIAPYESVRRIRQAWDDVAKPKYSPSLTQDFLKVQGTATGAMKGTGAIRDALASLDPMTAAANAEYSLYRTANDVLEATKEIERTRPKVGRQIIARGFGTVVGEHAGGLPGAVAGFVLGPTLQSALDAGLTTKLQTARLLQSMASALRKGDLGQVTSLRYKLRALGAQAAREQGQATETGSSQPIATGP